MIIFIEYGVWVAVIGAFLLSAGALYETCVLISRNFAARVSVLRAVNNEPQLLTRTIVKAENLTSRLDPKADLVLARINGTQPIPSIDKEGLKVTLAHLLNEGSDRFIIRASRTASRVPPRPNLDRQIILPAIDLLNEIVNDPEYFNAVVTEISDLIIEKSKNEVNSAGGFLSRVIELSLRGMSKHTLTNFVNFLIRDITMELVALHQEQNI